MNFIKNSKKDSSPGACGLFGLAALILFLLPPFLGAQNRRDPRGDLTVNQISRYTKLELKSQKRHYKISERIPIRFRVKNTGYQPFRIYPTGNPGRSFRFLVLDERGREVRPRLFADDFSLSSKQSVNLTGASVKEIILSPGEVFEKTIDLLHYYSLEAGKSYRIKGYFWPNARFTEIFLRSNNLVRLRIDKKRSYGRKHSSLYVQNQNEPILTPEETVYLFLSAEMRRNWKNYLKYIDLSKFITAYERYAARYVQAKKSERHQILKDFQDYLLSEPSDRLQKFKILSAEPERKQKAGLQSKERYRVRVLALRSASGFSSRYEYTYTLEKKQRQANTYWQVIYVEAILKSSGGS